MLKFTKSTKLKVFLTNIFSCCACVYIKDIFAFDQILTHFNYLYRYLLASQLFLKDLFDNSISLTVVNFFYSL